MAKVFWTAVNTEKNHTASSPDCPRQSNHRMDMGSIENTISWAQFSDGFRDRNGGYQETPLQLCYVPDFRDQPTLNSGTQTSPSWNRILIRSISDSKTSTLVCGCQDVSRLKFDPILTPFFGWRHNPSRIAAQKYPDGYRICFVIFHSNSQPRSMMTEFGYIILTGPYSMKSANVWPTWYP